jgi:hypothetical protein
MKRTIANYLSQFHKWPFGWFFDHIYPHRLKVWLFLNGD